MLQYVPEKPEAQEQKPPVLVLVQVAPFMQGLESQNFVAQ